MAYIITPFEYTQVKSDTIYEFDGPEYNYTYLDLFLLLTKITPILQDRYGPLSVIYTGMSYEGNMRLVIKTAPNKIREEDVPELNGIVHDLINDLHEHSILLDLSKNLYNNVFVPSWYINSMVPRIKVPNVIYGADYLFLDLSNYINDPERDQDYLDLFTKLQTDLIDLLERMYVSGYHITNDSSYPSAEPIEGYNIDLKNVRIITDDYLMG